MGSPIRRFSAFIVCLVAACTGQAQVKSAAYGAMLSGLLSHSVPEVSVAALSGSPKEGLVLLDARERNEYAVSHLEGARWVGYNTFDPASLEDLPRASRIVVYCAVGYRSEKVAEQLLAYGFTNVQNLYGGIFEWVNQGYAVRDAEGTTQRVHAYDRKWGVWLKKGQKVY